MSPMAVSRDMLMEKLWDDQAFIGENTLNVNVVRLRKKLYIGSFPGAIFFMGTGSFLYFRHGKERLV